MSTTSQNMRSPLDRLRHTLLFEGLALAMVTPVVSTVFQASTLDALIMNIILATTAMTWNYLFNLLFDHYLVRTGKSLARRPVWTRVAHACLFEGSLLCVIVPFISWWLHISMAKALIADIGFALFYLVYAFVYNWAYDLVFPVPQTAEQSAS